MRTTSCAVLLFTLACSAPPSAPQAQSPVAAPVSSAAVSGPLPSTERLHADVAWLADDAQEGRRAGTPAGRRAAHWIGERFAALGLEPAGEDGSWFQPFQVPLPIADGGGSEIGWVTPDGQRHAIEGAAAVLPLFCSDGASASGRVAWRGFGIVDEAREHDDYAEADVGGRVVVIVRGAPPLPEIEEEEVDDTALVQHGEGWGNSASIFTKVMNAKRRGAVAVIVAEHPAAGHEPLHFDASRSAQANVPALYLTAWAAERIVPGYADRVRAADGGTGEAWDGESLDVTADVRREKGEALNVLARLPGRDAARVVVIGAHFDHLGHGGEGSLDAGGEAIHNGADDNASGTAAVLEMARLWRESGAEPVGDIVFALWSGEELGLLGSEYWAQHPTVELDDVAMNLNLDMVGRAGDQVLTVLGAGTAAEFPDLLGTAAIPAGLDLKVNRSGQGVGGSDHQTFLKRQIPAVHFFSGLHADYHKPSDDTERFEAEGTARVVSLGRAFVEGVQALDALEFTEVETAEPGQPTKRESSWSVWFGTVPEYSYEGVGLLLAGTSAGGPAEKAGLLAGDTLLQVGEVEIENIYDFVHALQVYKPGNVVLTRYLRDGVEQQVRITLLTRDTH